MTKFTKVNVIIGLLAAVLTARIGTIQFNGHKETWYNLRMNRIVQRADSYFGLSDVYEVREEDGVKIYNGLVICAADWRVHPYGSTVETSKGLGVVLDHHTVTDNPELIDIAVAW